MIALILAAVINAPMQCPGHTMSDTREASGDAFTHTVEEDLLAQCMFLEQMQMACQPRFKSMVSAMEASGPFSESVKSELTLLRETATAIMARANALATALQEASVEHTQWLAAHAQRVEELKSRLVHPVDRDTYSATQAALAEFAAPDEHARWVVENAWANELAQLEASLAAWVESGQALNDDKFSQVASLTDAVQNRLCVSNAFHDFKASDLQPRGGSFREVFNARFSVMDDALGQLRASLRAVRQMRLTRAETLGRAGGALKRLARRSLAQKNLASAAEDSGRTDAFLRWTDEYLAFDQAVYAARERAYWLLFRRNSPVQALRVIEPTMLRAEAYVAAPAVARHPQLQSAFVVLRENMELLRGTLRWEVETKQDYHAGRRSERVERILFSSRASPSDECFELGSDLLETHEDEALFVDFLKKCGGT